MTNTDDTRSLLDAVTDVARLAGDVALRHFKSALVVEWKGDGSPVTIADREAEAAARTWISARFPNDGIVGEEMGALDRGGSRRWIIDPIDGTKTFVHGVPLWGTLVAVANGNEILAGAAYFPALGEMLCAAPGAGCWWNGSRAWVSSVNRVADATVLTTDEQFEAAPERRDAWRTLASRARLVRSWGDCYGYLLVATGRAEAMVDGKLADWDAAALMPAIVEAGGTFTDWHGAATPFGGSAIATNAALATDVRALLSTTGPSASPSDR